MIVTPSGDVVGAPVVWIYGERCDDLTAAIWREYYADVVAAPFDADDPYACEIGGES